MPTPIRPSLLKKAIRLAVKVRKPILVVGAPGVGKSEAVYQVAAELDCDLILTHPGVNDPTDAKGLPWPDAETNEARFIPFGDLAKALRATKLTVWFLDDFGQASPAVQAAYMQLLLAREIAGHKLPDCIVFVVATNRRADRAGVSGILEPVKSRMLSIVHVAVNLDDWVRWAYDNAINPLVIAYLRFRSEMLHKFEPSSEIENYPCPRTWYHVSLMMESGELEDDIALPMLAGAVGEAAATEFCEFVATCSDLPIPESVLLSPKTALIPAKLSTQYALAVALAGIVTEQSFAALTTYALRMVDVGATEIAVRMVKDATALNPALSDTQAFIAMATGPMGEHLR